MGYLDAMNVFCPRLRHRGELRHRNRRSHGFRAPGRHPSQPGSQDNAQTELVEHGVTGFVVNSPDEYAQAVAFLLSNPEKAVELGTAAREKALKCYGADRLTPGLEALYEYFYNKNSLNLDSPPNLRAIER